MWQTRIAHEYRLPVDAVTDWSERSLASAIGSLLAGDEKCPACGLSEEEQWSFTAEPKHCPSCHDRDDKTKAMNDGDTKPAGTHLRWQHVGRPDSAAGMYTPEGALERATGHRAGE